MSLVLTVNAGSSSIKLALFGDRREGEAHLRRDELAPPAAFERVLAGKRASEVTLVVHRVVHGGSRSAPALLDAEAEAEIEAATRLAPLHNPRALEWIRAGRAFFGDRVPAVAVFDTAFFASLPEVARTYALPRELSRKKELRRYGFHGIAHESLWRSFAERRPELASRGRVVSLQLGAGCSAAALRGGSPVDTSMGFTPLEGLVMATRAGDVDPGLLLHLQREGGASVETLDRMLSEQSGLLGVSSRSADMRELLASSDPAARLAVDLFCYRAKKYVGAYAAALGGLDAVLLGGGIGEHSSEVRARVLSDLGFLGIEVERAKNEAVRNEAAAIHAGRVEVWVFPVDEELLLVAKGREVLSRGSA
jgi:acetate kinase